MTRAKTILAWAACAWLAAACGDNDVGPSVPPPGDAGLEPLTACVDRPTDLPRPPTGALPCELIPPGLSLAR